MSSNPFHGVTQKLNQQPVIDLKTVGDCSIDSDIIFSQLSGSGCTRGIHTKLAVPVQRRQSARRQRPPGPRARRWPARRLTPPKMSVLTRIPPLLCLLMPQVGPQQDPAGTSTCPFLRRYAPCRRWPAGPDASPGVPVAALDLFKGREARDLGATCFQ